MVVVDAGPASRLQPPGVNQRLLIGDHLVKLLQLSFLPCQLGIYHRASPWRRARPSAVAVLVLFAGPAPLPGAFLSTAASAATSAAASAAAPAAPAQPLSASSVSAAAFSFDTRAASLFRHTAKLIFGWTPTFAPLLTPAVTVLVAGDAGVLLYRFKHGLLFVCLWFLVSETLTEVRQGWGLHISQQIPNYQF